MAELIVAIYIIIMDALDALRRELEGLMGLPIERLDVEENDHAP
jgi:hypothetical protein